jgi:ABC-type multidrug transport system permease subunit
MNEKSKDPELERSELGHGLPTMPPPRYSPLWQLIISRVRGFYREPQAIFWVYVFPLLLAIALGIAFRDKPVGKIVIDVQDGEGAKELKEELAKNEHFKVEIYSAADAAKRLERGQTEVVVKPGGTSSAPRYDYTFDQKNVESENARNAVDSYLARHNNGTAPAFEDHSLPERSGSYITFLIPGLIGMNLMGGGLWGVGFATVDLRVRKLLKRLIATPMRKSDFLLSIMLSRLIFALPEIVLLLGFAWLVFGVEIKGNLLSLMAVVVLGSMSFMGVGLLMACRAQTLEAISGLMNLVMLPMYIVSGVFFSSKHFPDMVQPLIKLLPLTALNDALRGVMTDGEPLWKLWPQLLIIAVWGGVSYVLALRWFRWT